MTKEKESEAVELTPTGSSKPSKDRPINLFDGPKSEEMPSPSKVPRELKEGKKWEERATSGPRSMARGLRLEIMKSDMNRENKPQSRKVLRPISDIERAKSHGHNSDVPQFVFSLMSGLIVGIFMYVTCSVFGILIFEVDERLFEFDMFGTYMALAGFIIGGAITTTFSACPILISGPDINPILFLIEAASVVAKSMKGNGTDEVIATVVFTIIFATFIVSVIFFMLGRFRMTNFVQFMPAAVHNGFLASVGILIVKEAVIVATGQKWKNDNLGKIFGTWGGWKLILPVIPIGLPLYFLKRNHVLHPSILIPLFLFGPLILFYIILAGSGISIAEARQAGWYFHVLEGKAFYEDWAAVWLSLDKVNWNAFYDSQPTVWIMMLVVTMDTLVKLTGIEKVAGLNLDLDKEVELQGMANMAGFMGISVPTYALTSFTALNKATTGQLMDRIPGYVAVVFCTVFYFWGYPVMNFMPRFLCAGLILYKGTGAIWENTFEARTRLSKMEMSAVVGIMLVTYFLGLVAAVVVGIVLSSVIFVVQYARRYDIKHKWSLKNYHSSVVRLLLERQKLEQFGNKMFALQLRGYLFFGSAVKILRLITEELSGRDNLYPHDQVSHVVLDFETVTGMDGAAAAMFLKIMRFTEDLKMKLVWSCVAERIRRKLIDQGVKLRRTFPTFDHAVEYVEDCVLHQANVIRSRWFVVSSMIKMQCLASHTVFTGHFDELLSETHIAKYCKTEKIDEPGTVIFQMGQELSRLWLLHRGKVELTVPRRTIGGQEVKYDRVSVLKTGVISQTLPGMICSETATCLVPSTFITIDKDNLFKLQLKYPWDALKLQRLIIQDIAETKGQLEHKTDNGIEEDAYLKQQLAQEAAGHNRTPMLVRAKSKRMLSVVSSNFRKRARSKSRIQVLRNIERRRSKIRDYEESWKSMPARASELFSIPSERPISDEPIYYKDRKAVGKSKSNIQKRVQFRDMETKDVDNIDDGHAADNEDNEPESPSGLPGETVDELRGTPKKHRRLSSLSKAGKLNSKLHLTPDLTFMPKKRRRSLIERAKSGPFTTYLPTASPLLSLARQKTKTDETQILKTENLVHARPSRISNVLAGDSKSAIRIPDPRFRTDSEISESDRKDTETEIDEKAITKSSRGPYVLSRHQRFTYTQIFKNLSERKQMWGSISKEKTLDIEYLRHALLDCGYYRTQSEMNRIKIKLGMEKFAKMNLDQFLMFMTRVSMAQISKSMREEYKSTYLKYAKDPGAGLTIEELGQMMTEMFRDAYIQDDIDNIINQWGNKHARTVNFQQFISMMAFSQMQNKLERQVERKAFRLFAGNQGRRRIYYRNIQTAIKNMTGVEIDDVTAKEMLWEADVNQKGFLDKHDFLQLVITVFKPGYVVLWNYKKNRAETVQLDALNEEEFEKLDGETKYWKDQIGISDEEDVMAESETEESGPEGTDIPETDTGGKPSDATECGEPPAGDQPRTSVVSI